MADSPILFARVLRSTRWSRADLPDYALLAKALPSLDLCGRVWMLHADDSLAPDMAKALAPGERWITVHAPGHEKGTPILIQEHPDGTATVVGGAGGSMNHLKLRGIKPQSDYRQELAEKQKGRQEAKKQATARDKELGIYDAKQGARKQLKADMEKGRADFVSAAAKLAGWDESVMKFDETTHSDLSPAALDKARKEHQKGLFQKAKALVDLNRKRLVEDADARAASGLGELPLHSADPESLAASDLDPMPEKAPGLGFSPEYKARAEQAGLTQADLQAEVGALSHGLDPQKLADKKEAAAAITTELEKWREANPDTLKPDVRILDDAKDAAALVMALKKLRLVEAGARDAAEAIDAGDVESKASILEVSDAQVDEAVRKQMEDDVRTLETRSFLQEADKLGGEAGLGGSVGTGAYNAVNAFSTTVGGEPLIDRSVLDVLGIAGAAAVLARRVSADLKPDELENAREAMAEYHVAHMDALQKGALAQAQKFHDAAAALAVPEANNGFELAEAQSINAKRRDAVGEAKKIVGQALGEMQANAAIVSALQGNAPESVDVSMGKLAADTAITQLHAIGLSKGDYELSPAGGNLVCTIKASGLDKLAKPVDREGMAIVRRNLDIIEGKYDEENWLPQGFARRPDLAMHAEPGVAPRLAEPFKPGADLGQSLRDYIGGRVADGDALSDILADCQSADFYQKAGDNEAYRKALDEVAPLKTPGGKMRPIESLQKRFEGFADAFCKDRFGDKRSPLHRQTFDVDQHSVDALHRALAEHPEGVAAFKPVGELSHQERRGLRDWWYANVAKEDPGAADMRHELDDLNAAEPQKESADMFGDVSTNPDWQAWRTKRDDLAGKVSASNLDWKRYVDVMGSPQAAVEAVQDLVRSKVGKSFADHHNTLKPGAPLKVGKAIIRGNLDHLDAVDPKAREARLAKQKELVDSLRERADGKYASGSVKAKMADAQEKAAAFAQAQMGFFSSEELPDVDDKGGSSSPAEIKLGADERFTLGHAAEQKLAGMMSVVGQNFKPGQPTKIWAPSMNGKFIAQQRAIKHVVANKRDILAYGAGSGKTGISLGAFTELHSRGEASRGLFLVPSVVQGQFGGEALRFLEPGKYKWHAEPGASREERLSAYKDPSNHFCVMTHQSFRDDMVHLGAKHAGVDEGAMVERLAGMAPADRQAWVAEVMEKEGIHFDASFIDEMQDTTNRAGKENSSLANVVDALTDHTPIYVGMSGDPVKNDPSELQDSLAKCDRKRYGDRSAFMRRYGSDALAAKQALKREMARHVISNMIRPDVSASHTIDEVDLSAGQKSALADLGKAMAKCRIARMGGKVDVEAAQAISPESFEGVPEEDHAKVAGEIQKSLGILKNSAERRVINSHPDNAKIDRIVEHVESRKGKQGVIFANRRAAVSEIEARLKAKGLRVVVITGSDSAADKDAKRKLFNPEQGKAQADVLVASDAAAVGMNLQSGQYLIQHDIPDTAKTSGQRNARIHRLGQKQDVELIQMKARHKSEDAAQARLVKKSGLQQFMLSPFEGLDDNGLAHFLHQRAQVAALDQGGLF